MSEVPNLVVHEVRIVAHTIAPVAPGAQLSQNHWSYYLLVRGGGSVRLNMATNPSPTNHDGVFTVTRHQYDLTTSAIKSWDFSAKPNITVGMILRLLRDKGRLRYRMTSNGVGCRHWV